MVALSGNRSVYEVLVVLGLWTRPVILVFRGEVI
jgi:hypothetical protein